MTPALLVQPGAVPDSWMRGSEMAKRTAAEERFWSRVDRNGPVPDCAPHLGPCWLWIGSTKPHRGYGRYIDGGRIYRVHRYAYEKLRGPIPDGLVLDHLCRVKHCVNPDHLEAVTQRENVLRGVGTTARQAKQTHCIHGHEFTPENTVYKANGTQRACRKCRERRNRERYERLRLLSAAPSVEETVDRG